MISLDGGVPRSLAIPQCRRTGWMSPVDVIRLTLKIYKINKQNT